MVALRASMPDLTRQASVALFALGYWAGCRVSDVSWIMVENCHVGPKADWVPRTLRVVATGMRQSAIWRAWCGAF